MKIRTAIHVTIVGSILPVVKALCMDVKSSACPGMYRYNSKIAINKPTSPMRVTMNAFLAAAFASGLKYQNPTSKKEHTPTSSQKM
ncbi:hypothetical protein D3C86_1615520 [compost metagenome]